MLLFGLNWGSNVAYRVTQGNFQVSAHFSIFLRDFVENNPVFPVGLFTYICGVFRTHES